MVHIQLATLSVRNPLTPESERIPPTTHTRHTVETGDGRWDTEERTACRAAQSSLQLASGASERIGKVHLVSNFTNRMPFDN